MATTITQLRGARESEAAMALWKLYELLNSLSAAQRQRVYARWEHVKLIRTGAAKTWESELRRVTKQW